MSTRATPSPRAQARLARDRRRDERKRLAVLLQWLAAHAIVRWRGRRVTPELMAESELAVAQLLADVADDGHLLYFGIRDAADLGEAPIALYLTDDSRYPYGTTALELLPLADHIMRGGDRGQGWRSPGELTLEDLALAPAE
ncbi:MAG TPA: hypothetical protein VLB44_01175 [Kofleriaceae bacterium]|nr:hypothetical protein [Kofleriaceae bacterium]